MLATFFVTNDGDAPENTPAAVGTLRQAIFDANQQPDHDTIEFSTDPADGLNGATILLTHGQLSITESVTIDATMLSAGLTIDAGDGTDGVFATGDGHSVFVISIFAPGVSVEVEINGLTLTGGNSSAQPAGGGAILSSDTVSLTVKNSQITNSVSGTGGGIYAHFGLAV